MNRCKDRKDDSGEVNSPEARRCSAETRESVEESDGAEPREACERTHAHAHTHTHTHTQCVSLQLILISLSTLTTADEL